MRRWKRKGPTEKARTAIRRYVRLMELAAHARETGATEDEVRETIALERKKYRMRCAGHDVELDHIWPKSKGGSSRPCNLRIISKKENRAKGAKIIKGAKKQ